MAYESEGGGRMWSSVVSMAVLWWAVVAVWVAAVFMVGSGGL